MLDDPIDVPTDNQFETFESFSSFDQFEMSADAPPPTSLDKAQPIKLKPPQYKFPPQYSNTMNFAASTSFHDPFDTNYVTTSISPNTFDGLYQNLQKPGSLGAIAKQNNTQVEPSETSLSDSLNVNLSSLTLNESQNSSVEERTGNEATDASNKGELN